MNYSAIQAPGYWPLLSLSCLLPFVGFMIAGFILIHARTNERPRLSRRAKIAIVAAMSVATAGSLALMPAIQGLRHQQDRNFAEALQREYAATSSTAFSDLFGTGTVGSYANATLTRDGHDSYVRFLVKDDVITVTELSEAPYPKPAS